MEGGKYCVRWAEERGVEEEEGGCGWGEGR